MKIEMRKLEDIKPYPRNAKRHNVEHIKNSLTIGAETQEDILERTIDQPIVVDAEGVIIKGHGRLKAAKELGLESFPVIVRDDLTKAQVKLARLADNKASEGGWDLSLYTPEVIEIGELFPDLDLPGFGLEVVEIPNEQDLEDFFGDMTNEEKEDKEKKNDITCPECGCVFKK